MIFMGNKMKMQRHPVSPVLIAAVPLPGLTQLTANGAELLPDSLALIDAAKRADRPAVSELLEAGTEVNGRYGDGTTALHWAAHRDALDLVRTLLEAGANPTFSDDHGVTPLSLACLNGNLPIVEALLNAGADANAAVGARAKSMPVSFTHLTLPTIREV